MITKDGRDLPIEQLTPENYLVPKGEEMTYHCLIEVKTFDNRTGEKISRARVQKFGKKIFENLVRDSLMKQGYTITVLYNPNAYIEKMAARQKQSEQEKRVAEQARFDAAVKAAVAKALAEAAVAKAPAEATADKQQEQGAEDPLGEPEQEKKPGRRANK